MKRTLSILFAALLLTFGTAAGAAEPDWSAVDKIFGGEGKAMPGGVHRYGWPRSDLNVTIGGVKVEAGLALGSWGAFVPTGKGDEWMTMGDLALLESEVSPVVTALQAGGLDVLAIHNHLVGEKPPIIYVHFAGHGEPAALAKGLKGALEKTKTPAAYPGTNAEPSAADQALLKRLQGALGRTGTLVGRVLQVGVPRAERIEERGMEVPASMGMSNSMNFQIVGDRIATTGDFVLIAPEVNPVIRELRAHGVDVTALHSHMLEESPRLFFMHFWAVDTPEKVGGALKAALSRIHTK